MKKILSFILAIFMVLSLFVFCGCDNKPQSGTDESSATADESPLAGIWTVAATDDEIEWLLNSQDTLHITKVSSGQKYTTVCKYSYDNKTGEFEYIGLSSSVSFKGTVELEETSMIVKSADGAQKITLYRMGS